MTEDRDQNKESDKHAKVDQKQDIKTIMERVNKFLVTLNFSILFAG